MWSNTNIRVQVNHFFSGERGAGVSILYWNLYILDADDGMESYHMRLSL